MYKYKNLPPIADHKLIKTNFHVIQHLKGSKMIDDEDQMMGINAQAFFTTKKCLPTDNVIITEKIDGMNAGVIKVNGKLYPITKRGYDSRTMPGELQFLGEEWAKWVDEHYNECDSVLDEGCRLVFENAILMHTLSYKFDGDPVFLLAHYDANNVQSSRGELGYYAMRTGFRIPPLLNAGAAIPPEIIINQYPDGVVGSEDGIEGIVYTIERDGKIISSAKYVSNKLMGTKPDDYFPQYYNKRR